MIARVESGTTAREGIDMKRIRHRSIALAGLALLWLAHAGFAALPEPDHLVYGSPTRNGETLEAGLVTAVLAGEALPIAQFDIGSNPAITGHYVLRIPIDSVDPRPPGKAREGDAVELYVDGVLAGATTIGERGTVQFLDIDEAGGLLPTIAIADFAKYEGAAGNVAFALTVTLSEAADEDVTFNWTTVAQTATSGVDYIHVAPATIGTIAAGNLTTMLTVTVKGDVFAESNETLLVNLSNPSANAVIVDGQAVMTILDDDTPPAISIADVDVIEGDSGQVMAVFELTTTRPIAGIVSVGFSTADQSATTADLDYVQSSGTAFFAPDSTTTTISIAVNGDGDGEEDETFLVNLAGASGNATIADPQGVGTIRDDDGFLTFVESELLTLDESPLFGASGVAVSPGGLHVYVTGRDDDGLATFERDPVTGGLAHLETLYEGDDDGDGPIDGLDGAEAVIVSPDGAHVYVTGFQDSAVAAFERDPVTGLLDFLAVYKDTSQLGTVQGLLGAAGIVQSADGAHVYVAGSSDDAIVQFDRDDDENSPTYGELTFAAYWADGLDLVDGIDGVLSLAVSADGHHLYAASAIDGAVATFLRDDVTGALTWVGRHADGVAGVDGLSGASSVAIAPDGQHVYVTGAVEDAIATFARNDATGALTYLAVLRDGINGVDGLDGATGVKVSFDNRFVYVCGYYDDSITVFDRDAVTGDLDFREIQRDGFGANEGLARANDVAVSHDDQHLYVAGENDDRVVVFVRDAIAPALPSLLESSSHLAGVWSNDPTVDVEWSPVVDNPGGTGVAGFSVVWDDEPLTSVDAVVDLPPGAPSTTSPPLPSSADGYYFHLRVCDLVQNCSPTAHLGPFLIDTILPVNPATIASTSHVVNVPTSDSTITMVWSLPATDPLSGPDGFGVTFVGSSTPGCDEVKDFEETTGTTTSDPLTDGLWWFHLCTLDNAGNWSAASVRGPYIVETAPPRVTAVSTVADTGNGLLDEDEMTASSITQILVTFSEAVADPAGDSGADDATNVANYPLVRPGIDGVFQTATCAGLQGDDQAAVVESVVYENASLRSSVRVRGAAVGSALDAGKYRFIVCGSTSIVDATQGNPLDGNSDGTGGDDFVREFVVVSTNKLKNPNFDTGLSSWTLVPPAGGVVAHSADDTDGLPMSGSAEALFSPTDFFVGVTQCVAVGPFQTHALFGRVRIESVSAIDPLGYGQAQFFGASNCSNPLPGDLAFSSTVAGDSGGLWLEVSGAVSTPADTMSVRVSFYAERATGATFEAGFDHLRLNTVAVIFADGFESGNTAAWSNEVPDPTGQPDGSRRPVVRSAAAGQRRRRALRGRRRRQRRDGGDRCFVAGHRKVFQERGVEGVGHRGPSLLGHPVADSGGHLLDRSGASLLAHDEPDDGEPLSGADDRRDRSRF